MLFFTLLFAANISLVAQKIGYVNLEAVVSLMPEVKAVNQELQTYQLKLEEQLKIKADYAEVKYREYAEEAQREGVKEEDLKPYQDELVKLQQEVQTFQEDSRQKLGQRRAEKMGPILEKMQKDLELLRKELAYDVILNMTDGSGVSIVLYAPEEHNLTKKLIAKLGLQLPTATAATTTPK